MDANIITNTSANRQLTARERATLRYLWVLKPEEIAKLNRYFLCFQTGNDFLNDTYQETGRLYLKEGGLKYEVLFDSAPTDFETVDDIGLSFRCNYVSQFAVVLCKLWKDTPTSDTSNKRRG